MCAICNLGSLGAFEDIQRPALPSSGSMRKTAGRRFPAISQSTSKNLSSLFPSCTSLRLLQQLHAQIILHGLHISTFFGSKLANAYFASTHSHFAQKAFDQLSTKNPQSWNTMLSGYLNANRLSEVLHLYKLFRSENQTPDSYSLAFAIRACAGLLVMEGRSIHCEAIKFGIKTDPYVSPSLVNMYQELGFLEDAEQVFEEAPLLIPTIWGLMMKGYSRALMDLRVLELFDRMKELEIQLDLCAAVCLARAYGSFAAARHGCAIHGLCIKSISMSSNIYLQSSLLDMYLKSEFTDCARKLFFEIPCKDIVSWSTMVAGYARCGKGYESLQTFQEMLAESVLPNAVTLASVLLACSHLGGLQQGKSIHGYTIRHQVELDVVAYTALLDMYAKCGSVEMAYKVFGQMPERNVFSWSAMIAGFGMHGLGSRALDVFAQMISVNILPNSVTLVSVLSACSHTGMFQEGRDHFESMIKDYGLIATNEHYSCMVDLLGRAGFIEEAETLIKQMPIEPVASVWGALLGACRIHNYVELAAEVANKLFLLEHDLPGTHVLLSNIFGASEMWEMVKIMRELMNERGMKKILGFSSIEISKKVYIFYVMDGSRTCDPRIAELWNILGV